LFAVVHPDQLTEVTMREKILAILPENRSVGKAPAIDMDGLFAIEQHVRKLLGERQSAGWVRLQQVYPTAKTEIQHADSPVHVLAKPLPTAQH